MTFIGIYKIRNTENGNFYLGSSDNIHRRFSRHKLDLSKNRHDNPHLQNAIKEGRYHKNKVPISEYEIIKLSYLSGNSNQRQLSIKYGVSAGSMYKLLKKLGVK